MDFLLPLAALAALLVGPVFWHFSTQSLALGKAVDGFAIVAVGGLTLLLIAPGAVAVGGIISAGLLLAGLFLPRLLHQLGPRGAGSRADRVLLAGLVIHATIESAALAASADGSHLGLAIVAHRVPVGLAIFMLAPSTRDGWIAVALIVLASLLGYAGGYNIALLQPHQHAWLDGFVAGSLLHVIQGHHAGHDHGPACDHEAGTIPNGAAETALPDPQQVHHHQHDSHDHNVVVHPEAPGPDSSTLPGALGALAGAAVLAGALIEPHGHHHMEGGQPHLFEQFMSLALICAPALLAGYIIAGLISSMLGSNPALLLGSGNRLALPGQEGSDRSATRSPAKWLALSLSTCPSAATGLYESLLRWGAAPVAGLMFLMVAPVIGLDALAISLPLLGTELTVVRLLAALLVAVVVALVMGLFVGLELAPGVNNALPAQADQHDDAGGSLKTRLLAGMAFGLAELFDHTMPWVLLGLLLAILLTPVLQAPGLAGLAGLPAGLQVPLLTLLAIPVYVGASGATPIAAVAIQAGLSPGAAMAFLIAGPATNVSTFAILARLHGRRFAVMFSLAIAMAAMAVGWGINQLDLNIPELLSGLSLESNHGSALQKGCLGLLALLLLASLFRQGPRGMLTQVMAPFRV